MPRLPAGHGGGDAQTSATRRKLLATVAAQAVGWPFWPSLRLEAEEVGLKAQPTSDADLAGV